MFLDIEMTALRHIMREHGSQALALSNQIGHADVVGRENTGQGILTRISINTEVSKIDSGVYSGPDIYVEGLEYPVGFVLFVVDGVMSLLDGSTIDDNTHRVDFSSATFRVGEHPAGWT